MSSRIHAAERSSASATTSHAMLRKSMYRTDRLGVAATSTRAFAVVLATACTRHSARAGRGCWEVERATRPPTVGLCGSRVAIVFGR